MELLVAMGIISTLLALGGTAALSVAREARSTKCRSNLRQMSIATESYRNANNDHLPAAILYERSTGSTPRILAWDFTQEESDVTPGALWNHADAGRVQECPSFAEASTFGADPYTGYNYNTTFLGAEGSVPFIDVNGKLIEGWAAARRGVPTAAQRKTDSCAIFGDGGWANGANKFMRAPLNRVEYNLPMIYAGGQAFRHGTCCNLVCLDGHTAAVCTAFEGEHASPWLLDTLMSFPRNGFLSDNDAAYDPR